MPDDFAWPAEGVSRAPYRVAHDLAIYRREQEVIFRGRTWNFLCLELEVAKPGDIRTTWLGETPVIVTRDAAGSVHAMINRCAHKGALVCLKRRDNQPELTCVYHSWRYGLDGSLQGVAFRNGLRGQGGMPADFNPARHGLRKLRVAVFCGLVWGTLSDEVEPLEDYLGETAASFLRRNLNRPLRLLGTHSQVIRNNWKQYAENVRDSYHATLLHTFYTAMRVNRLDMDGGILLSGRGWHAISYSKRDALREAAEYRDAKVHAASYASALQAPELTEAWDEFDDGITHSIQTIFPSLAVQYTLNSLAVRFFVPRGVDETELFWFYLGLETDTPEQTAMRVTQSNLTGAAGLVSLEDGCINEFVQRGTRGEGEAASAFLEMGGTEVGTSPHSRATETAVRGFWQGYREIMGF
jgi:anthranilate 1,2-dioxygenase large subunit